MSLRQRLLRAIDGLEIDSIDKVQTKEAIKDVLENEEQEAHCGYCGCEELVDAGDDLGVRASCGQWYYGQSSIPKDDALDLLDRLEATKYAVKAGDAE